MTLKIIFYLLIFPGFLFTAIAGLLASWVDRKVTARLQWRQGPPWYQPVVDILKLLHKEVIVPDGADQGLFLFAPLLAFSATIVSATLIGAANLWPQTGFVGDIIVAIYLLVVPAIGLIIGAAASRNPLASLGASREMKLILAYELPFLLALFVPVIKTGWQLSLGNIVAYQYAHASVLSSVSGLLAFAVALLCVHAKLGFVPFDASEAETEIMGGVLIEYSGAPLALFKLTKAMLLFILPVFLITLFWGGMRFDGAVNGLISLLKYVVLLVIIVIIKNTNPRVRVDQAIRFFWGGVSFAAIAAVILALLGV